MAFDFDTVIPRRGTDSSKWNRNPAPDFLPMPVADMDFRSSPAVLDALHRRVDHGVFGYADPPEPAVEAVCEKLLRDFGWEVDPGWLVWLPGLVVGLNVACRMLETPQEPIVSTTPIYPPFLQAPGNTGHSLVKVPLARGPSGYDLDWDVLEEGLGGGARMFLHCNPHNPAGRVFRRGDLERLAEMCLRHDVLICSDEIHCDLVLEPELEHIPMATLSAEVAARTITLMSPSKAFNLAGLMCSFAVIPDEALRRRYRRASRGIVTELNVFGYAATEAAYRHSVAWHRELLQVLRRNRNLVRKTVDALPGLWMPEIEATYLAWIDCRGRSFPCEPSLYFEKQGLGLSHGPSFGAPGFVRLNFGCPLPLLEEGLTRFSQIVEPLELVSR